jgi:hypothetical protein
MSREARRYLGLELAGAKNQKTALAALEYYPSEGKIFLLDIFERIAPAAKRSANGTPPADQALIELVAELGPRIARMGVNVPLELPPHFAPERVAAPALRWMRETTRRAQRSRALREAGIRVLDFTPYTQRPVELWARYHVLPHLPPHARFEIDEALGGTKAPLTARMHYLKKRFAGVALVEAWPKLTVAGLAVPLGLTKRTIGSYRHLEAGVHAREEILEALAEARGIFIYERDLRKLALSLSAFDAFLCAYTALLSDAGACSKAPKGFPAASGWVQYPDLEAGPPG